jgi:hypothetical protein
MRGSNGENVDNVNVCLLPDFDLERESNKISRHLNFEHFVRILKRKILSVQPRPLSTLAKQVAVL